jgi:uncharacterized protein YgfB (UPF0149 family)
MATWRKLLVWKCAISNMNQLKKDMNAERKLIDSLLQIMEYVRVHMLHIAKTISSHDYSNKIPFIIKYQKKK